MSEGGARMNKAEMLETLKRIRGVRELPAELLRKIEHEMPEGSSVANFLTSEELTREEERVLSELETKDEEDLTIYNEDEMTEEEIDELPEGALVRRLDGTLDVKVLDLWAPYQSRALRQPDTLTGTGEPLTKYGRMRRRYLEQWQVRTALELGEDLLIHCLEIQRQAQTMKRELMEQLQQSDPPPSRDEDPMGWVQHMNALDLEAEEIVTRTIVYA